MHLSVGLLLPCVHFFRSLFVIDIPQSLKYYWPCIVWRKHWENTVCGGGGGGGGWHQSTFNYNNMDILQIVLPILHKKQYYADNEIQIILKIYIFKFYRDLQELKTMLFNGIFKKINGSSLATNFISVQTYIETKAASLLGGELTKSEWPSTLQITRVYRLFVRRYSSFLSPHDSKRLE